MLYLLIGTDWTANRREILRRISEKVEQQIPGQILMVPELISHDMERRLCAAAGDTASRFAEVLSFTRLARRVTEGMGAAAVECLDDGGRLVAMAAAARALHSKLKAYAAVETKPEFLMGVIDAVDEFKRCRISAAGLLAAAARTEGSLAQKLEELSLLLDTYDGICQQGKRDPRDMEKILLEQLMEGDFGESHTFYIDGFPDFTRQHLAILEHLIRVSPEVTVSINCDTPKSGRLAFEKTGDTAAQLIRCAKSAGVDVRVITVDAAPSPLDPVRSGLFQGKVRQDPTLSGRLSLRQGDSIYEECLGAAEQVMDLVRRGSRYREISIVCGDVAAYRSTLDLVFHRCGIPLYRSGTDDILQKSVIASVLTALEAALGGFDSKDVLRYLRSVLSPLKLDQCDRVENYAIVWGIRGSKWLSPWENHPGGLGEPWNAGAEARLAMLEHDRLSAIAPLERLHRGFSTATRLAQQVEAVYDFFEEIKLSDRLDSMADELENARSEREAQIMNQLWEILLTSLEQLHDMLGHTKWDNDGFLRLFTLLLSQYDVGTIPPVLDAVMVGPVNAMRCQNPDHLIVLGAEEGCLPGYGGSTGVLTDQERVLLRSMGVPLTGGALEGLQAEFAEIYGVFCGARETVTVSYSGTQPSFVYRRLAEMAGTVTPWKPELGGALASTEQAGAYLARWNREAEAQELGVLDAYRDTVDRRDYMLGSVSREHIKALYGDALKLSASQVDRQGECRFSYFMKYGMRAKERKEATIDPAEFGTYVHAVLEDTAKTVMETGGFHRRSLDEVLEIAREFSRTYAAERFSEIDSRRMEYLFRRNGQELEMVVRELWQELRAAAFEPVDFETAFGAEDGLPAIDVSGRTMPAQLRGFVDRVDAWKALGQNYFRVVDYKTGKKDFDYCDVFNGIGLQMLLYLFALQQEGQQLLGEHPVPAGVQYFPARVPVLTADGRLTGEEAEQLRQKEWKRRGLLLHDEAVLDAMEPEGAPKRLPVSRKKDGSISGDLADREQLKLLREYVFILLGKMVDDIASGNVTPNPYMRGSSHSACAFCPYGAVCHREQVEGKRNYKAMSSREFWEGIEKEVDRHG